MNNQRSLENLMDIVIRMTIHVQSRIYDAGLDELKEEDKCKEIANPLKNYIGSCMHLSKITNRSKLNRML